MTQARRRNFETRVALTLLGRIRSTVPLQLDPDATKVQQMLLEFYTVPTKCFSLTFFYVS